MCPDRKMRALFYELQKSESIEGQFIPEAREVCEDNMRCS